MHVEAGVEAGEAAVLDNVGQGLEGAFVLITLRNSVAFRLRAVLLVRQKNRHLSTELRQLKRT